MEPSVDLKILNNNIAIVVLQDRESKNTFSRPLIEGIQSRFNEIRQNKNIKVVVVHGYENIFCAGGTKEELIGILKNKIGFNDLGFFRILIDCELPTIAAMQGHALGGGLVFGLYADIVIMAEECIYSTNFMRYGFTPGLGATLIVPEKIGVNLANEMLFSAKSYHGGELRDRGVPFKVVKKIEVINTASTIAKELADKPLESLKLLKKKMSKKILQQLPETIKEELGMHKISFALPGVRERIENLFGN